MKGSSVLKAFIVVLAAVFIINQIVSSVYKPVKTESAVYYTAVDGMNITGLIIRNEILVSYDGAGVMHFVTPDGNRVSKGGVIANIYDNAAASITVSEIEEVRAKISDLEDILSYNDIEAVNLDLINQRVEEKVNSFVMSTATGEYGNTQTGADELLSALNRKQAALGTANDFSGQLETLNNTLATLNASLPSARGQVLAAESGYFVSKTDGYENIFSSNDLTKITPEFLASSKAEAHPENIVGKIVSDYEWYIAAEVTINQSLNYKEGDTLKIQTSVKSSPELSVEVKKINISESGSSAVIIFSCNEMNSELAVMRSGPMTVVKHEYSGLRVDKKALRVVDGERGVYVLSGMQIHFVPVEIVYSNERYMICEKDKDSVLKLYDSVVVKGRNLYDGKIVS